MGRAPLTLISVAALVGAASAQKALSHQVEHGLALDAYHAGRFEEAIDGLRRSIALNPESELVGRSVRLVSDLTLALACAGRIDEAFVWMERSMDRATDATLPIYLADDALAELRRDPRWESMRKDLDDAKPYWLEERRATIGDRRARLEELRVQRKASNIVWQDGHSGPVRGIAFSPEGERLVSAGYDQTVRLWSTLDLEPPRTLCVCGRRDIALSFSTDGAWILVEDSQVGTATVFDGRSGAKYLTLGRGGECVRGAVFDGDDRVWTVTLEGELVAWNLSRGSDEKRLRPGVPARFVHVTPDRSRLLVHGVDGRVYLCDAGTGEILRTIGPADVAIASASVLPDGRFMLLGADGNHYISEVDESVTPVVIEGSARYQSVPGRLTSGAASLVTRRATGELIVSDTRTGEILSILVADGTMMFGWPAPAAGPGDLVAAQLENTNVRIWRAASAERTGDVQMTSTVQVLEFSAGGVLAIGTWNGIYLVDEEGHGRALASRAARVNGASSGQGGRVATGIAGFVAIQSVPGPWSPQFPPAFRSSGRVWDLTTGNDVALVSDSMFCFVEFDPSGTKIGLASRDGNALRDADGTRRVLPGVGRAIRFSPDGSRVVTTATQFNGRGSALLSSIDGVVLGSVVGLAWVDAMADICPAVFSPDGYLLITAHSGGALRVSSAFDAEELVRLSGHSDIVMALAFDSEGARLASCGLDGTTRIWDVESFEQELVLSGHTGGVWCCAFSLDDRWVATGGADGTVRVWDARTGAPKAEFNGHTDLVRWVGFQPVTGLLVSASWDGTARVYDLEVDREVARLLGHTGALVGAEFTDDGRILTWGQDSTVRVWDATKATGDGVVAPLVTHVEYDEGGWLTFDAAGRYVAGGRAEEWARVQVQGETYPLSSYADWLNDPEAVREALAGNPLPERELPRAPVVRTDAPPTGTVDLRWVEFSILAEDSSGLKEIRVERNGEEWRTVTDFDHLPRAFGAIVLDLRVEFPSGKDEMIVTVRATNKHGIKSVPRSIHRRYAPPTGDLYILALAVSDYDDDALDLASPAKDAAAIVALFEEQAGGLYRSVHAKMLGVAEGADVSRGSLEELRHTFLGEAGPEDTILVFVAGHGMRTESGEYYFLTRGATPARPWTGVPRSDLYKLVTWDRLQPRRRVLLMDTCHAGEDLEPGQRGVGPQDAFSQDEVDESLKGSGIYIVSGSTEYGAARETMNNGVFTAALLEGLAGAADAAGDGDGTIDITELIEYARRIVRAAEGAQEVTTPRVVGGTPFPLARTR